MPDSNIERSHQADPAQLVEALPPDLSPDTDRLATRQGRQPKSHSKKARLIAIGLLASTATATFAVAADEIEKLWDRVSSANTISNQIDSDEPTETPHKTDSSSGNEPKAPDTTDPIASQQEKVEAEKLDVDDIVKQYGLHSLQVRQLGGKALASFNADGSPKMPASTMKLVVVDTLLRKGISLDKRLRVSSELFYGKELENGRINPSANDLGVDTITLADAVRSTLGSKSSNVAANVIIKALGGVKAFTNQAHSYGYRDTSMAAYYSPTAHYSSKKSTIGDQTEAMDHLFTTKEVRYTVAQSALKAGATHNYYGVRDVVANKSGFTSEVSSNVSIVNLNGKKYIIGMYYNGPQRPFPASNVIKDANEAIKQKL